MLLQTTDFVARSVAGNMLIVVYAFMVRCRAHVGCVVGSEGGEMSALAHLCCTA